MSISEPKMFRRIALGCLAVLAAGSAEAADYGYGGGYGYGAGYRSPQYRGDGYYGGYGYRRPDGFAGRPGGDGYNGYATYPYRPDAIYNRPPPVYVGDRPVFTPEPVVEDAPQVVYQRRTVTKTVTTTVTTETVVAPPVGVGYVPW